MTGCDDTEIILTFSQQLQRRRPLPVPASYLLESGPMNIVSVVNQKGGVAKTTTVANVGASLAVRGYRTLLIDLDPQANLTLGLKRTWDDLPYALPDVMLDPRSAPISPIIRQVASSPLFLAPGHIDMARAAASLVRRDAPG